MKRKLIICVIILIITFFGFYPCLNNGFTNWDDDEYVTGNIFIRELSLQKMAKVFASFFYGAYIPLTTFSYALEYHFFKLNPHAYHATNFAIHLLNSLLVFLLIFLLSNNTGVAGLTAVLFGIHPLHVESVAWITERKDMLYSFFFLGAAIAYIYYRRNEWVKFYYLSLILFILSLLSKPAAVTLPLVLIAFDYLLGRKFDRKMLLEKAPFFILSVVFIVIAMFAQHSIGAMRQGPLSTIFYNILISTRIILFYLLKTIAPVKLSCHYPLPQKIEGWLPNIFLFSPIIIGGLIVLIFLSHKYTRKIAFGTLFFIITILPVLQLISVGQIIADRYTYIPLIGIFYILTEGFSSLWKLNNKMVKFFLGIILIVIIVLLSYLSRLRCGVWKDGITLWSDVIKTYPQIPYAYNNRGILYAQMKAYAWAINDFNQSLMLNPDLEEVYNNRGLVFYFKGDYELAISDFNEALRIKPDYAEAYNNRGYTYYSKEEFNKAIEDFNNALRFNSNYANAYSNRGNTYLAVEDYVRAVADFSEAIEINPYLAEVYNSRGNAYTSLGNYDRAIIDFTQTIKINPSFAEAYNNRGIAYCYKGDNDKALTDFNEALRINHNYASAYNNRGNVYSGLGKLDRALTDFNTAIRIDSTFADAYYNRAMLYFKKKEYNLALRDLIKFKEFGYEIPKVLLDLLKKSSALPNANTGQE